MLLPLTCVVPFLVVNNLLAYWISEMSLICKLLKLTAIGI